MTFCFTLNQHFSIGLEGVYTRIMHNYMYLYTLILDWCVYCPLYLYIIKQNWWPWKDKLFILYFITLWFVCGFFFIENISWFQLGFQFLSEKKFKGVVIIRFLLHVGVLIIKKGRYFFFQIHIHIHKFISHIYIRWKFDFSIKMSDQPL